MRLDVTDMGQVQCTTVSYSSRTRVPNDQCHVGGRSRVWSLNKKDQVLVTNDRQDQQELLKRIIKSINIFLKTKNIKTQISYL